MDADELHDPWGDPYRYDSGWALYEDGGCPDLRSTMSAIYSEAGTPGTSGNNMCDDIWVELGQ